MPPLDPIEHLPWGADPADIVCAAEVDPTALLRRIIARRPAWHRDAACAGVGTALFYPARNESNREALAVCNTCNVIDACRDDALAEPGRSDFGVRGGTTANARALMRRTAARHPAPSPNPRRKPK